MNFWLRCMTVFGVTAILVDPAIGQVRLGPNGPVTPAPRSSQDGAAGAEEGATAQPPTYHPQVRGVRLGPQGPYTPAPMETKVKSRPGIVRPMPTRRDPNLPETIKIAISPAPEPDLPLKYSLLPKYEDIKPGNSVPFYYRAVLSWMDRPKKARQPLTDNYDRWMNAPASNFPKREVRQFLKQYGTVFDEVQTAAHRERTKWSWRLQDMKGAAAIAFLLPEIQESRNLARLLYLKSRLQIAEGRYDEAIKTLQIGNKLARDVAVPPTLINDLVGIAIGAMMTQNVREMIGSPNSPNMYWALSKLPRPFIDMETAMRYEMSLPMKLFPSLKDAETAEHSPEEWSRLLGNAMTKLNELNGGRASSPQQRFAAQLGVAGLALMKYSTAKRDLIKWGYNPRKVNAMPVGQVVTIHQARTYRYMYQELMKWSNLPYHQSLEGMRRSQEKLKKEGYFGPGLESREVIPLAALLLPSVVAVQKAGARMDSRIAGLRVVEAIRMYAAGHEGKLPETLSDIREVPVPVNPITDQPFPYHFAANKAVLDIPSPPGTPVSTGWRFEISVRK